MKIKHIIILFLSSFFFVGCFNEPVPTPKPKTYFRIDVPMPKYKTFDTLSMPFSFEYPDYGEIERTLTKNPNNNWFNINFKDYGCKLYVTFLPLSKSIRLDTLVNDSYNFTTEHNKFSSGVVEREFSNTDLKVYGCVFEIKGSQVASPYQFYLTDSSRYFLRGALYFDFKPNNDSLSPIIKRVAADIDNMISTFNWK
jgi:gliding motility-associated lipoprotein GldD